MRARLERWIDALRTGFWFVPLVMLAASCALALWLLTVDERVDPGLARTLPWAYTGGPEGARSLLSTVAGSMITAASVTFSLASVALSIASQQYGSRVLRNFMRDRITQVLLGTFVATFLYSVLVVRAIRGSDVAGGFVPAIAVTVAIVLSVVSLVLLILFIHHVSASIQASRIVRVIVAGLEEGIPKLYPSETGEGAEADEVETFRVGKGLSLPAARSGYLQTLDLDGLMRLAEQAGVVVEVVLRPGDHAVIGDVAGLVWGKDEVEASCLRKMAAAFYFGGERTAAQDVRFQFQQMTDVVVRAMSAGINDPFTAVNGIDGMSGGLVLLAQRARVRRLRVGTDGRPRLYVPSPELGEVLRETAGHIAVYAAADPFVVQALERLLDRVEPVARRAEDRALIADLRGEIAARTRVKRREAGLEEA